MGSWDGDYVLEGLFEFGAPVNIWQMELDYDRSKDLTYKKIHMRIDDDFELFSRINGLFNAPNSWDMPRLIIMESPRRRSIKTDYWREFYIYKVTLYSLQDHYRPTQYPYDPWQGFTLGISFPKSKENSATLQNLFGSDEQGKR